MVFPPEYFAVLSVIRNMFGLEAAAEFVGIVHRSLAGQSPNIAVQTLSFLFARMLPWAQELEAAVQTGDRVRCKELIGRLPLIIEGEAA